MEGGGVLAKEISRACRVADVMVEAHFASGAGSGRMKVGVGISGRVLWLVGGSLLHVARLEAVAH